MIEIGSEFWNVPITADNNHLFPERTQWYLSGRSALQAVIRDLKNCHTVAMPSWCCKSIIKPFADAGIEIHYYPVYWDHSFIQEIRTDCDILFFIDYFGYTDSQNDLTGYHGIVIRDVTHSIFTEKTAAADYYIGSLRKWCGIWTGGFAWTENGHSVPNGSRTDKEYITFRQTAMTLKEAYLSETAYTDDRSELKSDYMHYFHLAEECLEKIGVVSAASRDIEFAEKMDIGFIRHQRKVNATKLSKAFPDWTIFPTITEKDCPMFVPIIVPNDKRDELHQHLVRNGIYCPIHWPISRYHSLNSQTEGLYRNSLSLVCDQRYSEDDMTRIIDTIKSFRERL